MQKVFSFSKLYNTYTSTFKSLLMVNMNYSTEICGKTQVLHGICIPNNASNCQVYKHIKHYTHNRNIDNKFYLFSSKTIMINSWKTVTHIKLPTFKCRKASVKLTEFFMEKSLIPLKTEARVSHAIAAYTCDNVRKSTHI